jgi:hypothetical protein
MGRQALLMDLPHLGVGSFQMPREPRRIKQRGRLNLSGQLSARRLQQPRLCRQAQH